MAKLSLSIIYYQFSLTILQLLLFNILSAMILLPYVNGKTDLPVIDDITNSDIVTPSNTDSFPVIDDISYVREPIKNIIGGVYTNNITLFFRNSPYRVEADLVIETNAILTIETGVKIYFDPGVGIKIKGAIWAMVNITN